MLEKECEIPKLLAHAQMVGHMESEGSMTLVASVREAVKRSEKLSQRAGREV